MYKRADHWVETPFYYRNKAQFPFGTDKEGNPVTGFYAGRTHDIIANTNCILGAAVNEHILESILDFMKKYKTVPMMKKQERVCFVMCCFVMDLRQKKSWCVLL